MSTPSDVGYAEQFAEFHSFELLGARLLSDFDNSLLREHLTEPGEMVSVRTGIHTGYVLVTVAAGDQRPEAPSTEWQTIVEAVIEATEDEIVVGGASSGANETLSALPAPIGGRLRVRVSAQHRDENYDGAGGEPRERYLIESWPDDSTDGRVVRDSGRASTELLGPSVAPQFAPPTGVGRGTATARTRPGRA